MSFTQIGEEPYDAWTTVINLRKHAEALMKIAAKAHCDHCGSEQIQLLQSAMPDKAICRCRKCGQHFWPAEMIEYQRQWFAYGCGPGTLAGSDDL